MTVRLRRLPAVTAVALHTTGPYWRLSGSLARLRGWMAEAGLDAAGAPLGLFHDDPSAVPPEETRYSLCYPLGAEAAEKVRRRLGRAGRPLRPGDTGTPGRETSRQEGPGADVPGTEERESAVAGAQGDVIDIVEFPAVEAVAAEYRGPAADSPAVYARVEAWMEERGYVAAGPPREVYHAEPGTLGKGMMHAEVQQPVRRRAPAAR